MEDGDVFESGINGGSQARIGGVMAEQHAAQIDGEGIGEIRDMRLAGENVVMLFQQLALVAYRAGAGQLEHA